jgi:hypothetical protein
MEFFSDKYTSSRLNHQDNTILNVLQINDCYKDLNHILSRKLILTYISSLISFFAFLRIRSLFNTTIKNYNFEASLHIDIFSL